MDKKLLIVDDDELTLQLYFLLLEEMEGICFQTRNGGLEALDYLEGCSSENWPHYIFVDLNMPDMTGFEFVDEFEKRFSKKAADSQIYVLTSSVSHRDIENGKNYPLIKDFLSKPLTEEGLKNIFENAPFSENGN